MKKILSIIVIFALLVIFVSPLMAQDTNNKNSAGYCGMLFNDSKLSGVFGVGQRVKGNLWSMELFSSGANKSLGVDIIYFVKPNNLIGIIPSALSIGAIAGPNNDWVASETEGMPSISYFAGATGVVCVYDVIINNVHTFDIWGNAKYTFEFNNSDSYESNWRIAAGLSMLF
ncbi:hypothetical protein M0R04_05955 [Candidatus Dojkabacteria bacterium]|jgi:hypothetical protein|nr:hypothetical protein [Candidatus Dojkabacteria bacterium]